jgi:hypothetical protein
LSGVWILIVAGKTKKATGIFPVASVWILYVGVSYVSNSSSRWGERLVFTAAKVAAI